MAAAVVASVFKRLKRNSMRIERLPDWETRLSRFIADHRDHPHEWGEWDCILMASSAIEAMTGTDPAAEYRGRYNDERGAAQALRDIGEGTLVKTIDAQLERAPVSMARRGDLVEVKGSIGVCIGGVAVFVGEERFAENAGIAPRQGLVTIPRTEWVRAWKVG